MHPHDCHLAIHHDFATRIERYSLKSVWQAVECRGRRLWDLYQDYQMDKLRSDACTVGAEALQPKHIDAATAIRQPDKTANAVTIPLSFSVSVPSSALDAVSTAVSPTPTIGLIANDSPTSVVASVASHKLSSTVSPLKPRTVLALACKYTRLKGLSKLALQQQDPDILRLDMLREVLGPSWRVYGCTEKAVMCNEVGRWHIECGNFGIPRT